LPGLKILIRALERLHLLISAYDAFDVNELGELDVGYR